MELLDLNGIDLPYQPNLLPSYDIRSKLQNIPTLNDFDVDENYLQAVDSKYYDITDFMSLNRSLSKYFALFIQMLEVYQSIWMNFKVYYQHFKLNLMS